MKACHTGRCVPRLRNARFVNVDLRSKALLQNLGERRGLRLPPNLERVEVMIKPKELLGHAGKQKVLIGEDVSERLDVSPAKVRATVTRRPNYAFKGCDGVIQAPPPAHIIESGLPL
jgi:transposase